MTTTIHFVRHGEVHNPTEILYARLPRFRLSTRGREQAQSAADYLKDKPLAAIFSSPMLRARQTAAIIAAPHDIRVKITHLLNEIHTPYEGKTHAFMEAMDWKLYEGLEDGYERVDDILSRIQKFVSRTRKTYEGKEVVAVTHGDIVLFMQLWARQLGFTHEVRRSIQPYPATASISTLKFHNKNPLPEFEFRVTYEKLL